MFDAITAEKIVSDVEESLGVPRDKWGTTNPFLLVGAVMGVGVKLGFFIPKPTEKAAPKPQPASNKLVGVPVELLSEVIDFLEEAERNVYVAAELKEALQDCCELVVPDYPECTGDPSSCPENEGRGCCATVGGGS